MDIDLQQRFTNLWQKYFNNAELPITCFFSKGDGRAEKAPKPKGHSCVICDLAKVRAGRSLYFNSNNLGCGGAKRYFGYMKDMAPSFRYFLSCGLEGKVEGERYKRTPDMVDKWQEQQVLLPAEGRNLVFKRWDKLTVEDEPEVVIFFAKPEVLSGLFTLANFDQVDPNGGVMTPFGAGCGTIVHHPWLEREKDNPRCTIGMFDPSARPCVPADVLTFAAPFERFVQLVDYMEESFLITDTWDTVRERID